MAAVLAAATAAVPAVAGGTSASTRGWVPTLPPATYKTVSSYTTIRMDDGVQLGATITFPSRDGTTSARGRFPVVFSMTPYGRDGVCGCSDQTEFPSRGIVSAVVDVRGTGGSGGNLDGNYFSPREQRDGYDLVEWFAHQRWSTGKVAMQGGSYLGITQYLTAEMRPPGLVAIAPEVALSDIYRDAYTYDGIPDFFFDTQYNGVQGGPGLVSGNFGEPGDSNSGFDTSPADWLDALLSTTSAKQAQAGSRPVALDYLSRPYDNAWYHARSPFYRVDRISVPVMIVDGWRDGAFVRGDFEMYQHLAQRRGVETRIDVNACTHKGCGAPFDPTHAANGNDNFPAIEFDFLSHYLRGTPEHRQPKVAFQLQPSGPYQYAAQWPPAGTRFTRYYLTSGGGTGQPLAGSLSVGRLATTPPGTRTTSSYFTDPLAGASMALDSYGTIAISPYVPLDQRTEDEQGLTWRTGASSRPLRLAGPIQLHLVAASSASDTDFVARLSDVAPDGSETVITEGALRASHRALDPSRSTLGSPYHRDDKPMALTPGTTYAFDVAIIPTAYQLAPGHSLQLRLTTDDFPTRLPADVYVNANDPAASQITPMPPAVNTVVEARAGSWLLLPLAPA
ncbi:MAG TPA: CocE/NonD family hydrolase [Mycobacteriales bacterium]|nr:CocE/NonD family hydrolase [Mycobacteriales bacterium]